MYKADRHVRTVTLIRWDGTLEEVEDDLKGVRIVCDPATDWPFVMAPVRFSKAGRVEKLIRPAKAGGRNQELAPYIDWAPSDPFRAGGSLFLNPELGLRYGEVLSAQHKDGVTMSRVPISKNFGTMKQRELKKTAKPKVFNRYEALFDDDDEDF